MYETTEYTYSHAIEDGLLLVFLQRNYSIVGIKPNLACGGCVLPIDIFDDLRNM